ncbi:MAG TPA: CHAT domain-containing protein, partial [Burkholderiaceae bacterium]
RALLDAEQELRRHQSDRAAALSTLLGEEDRQRRDMSSDAFKARAAWERRDAVAALKKLREQIKAGQAEVAAARAALSAQRERVTAAYPAYADLVTPATPKPAALRALLGQGEGLLVVHAQAKATLVWLIVPGQTQLAMHASPLGAQALSARVSSLRRMLDLSQPGAPALQTAELLALYRELIAPLAPDFKNLRSLIVASDGALAALPLAALVTEPGQPNQPIAWLARRLAVTQLPAAAALQALRRGERVTVAAKPLIGFGDPAFKSRAAKQGQVLNASATRYDAAWGFAYADIPPLPDTRIELQTLARELGADAPTDLYLGAAATREAVLNAPLGDRRVVAFATHGLMPGELPGVSKPALAMAATGREGESPLLELDDVLGLRLNAQWVLLSACNTAAGEQGGAAMSGLVRGFFFAGTRSVLATHWAVDSASAGALSVAALKPSASGRAESLRQAQLAMLDGRVGAGKWTHPYYWAGYALFGDPLR